jgi:transposase
MGMSRNTVRRYLREASAVRYGPRAPRRCKLDPHKAFLQKRIAQAKPDWIPATVLLREIQAAGYDGGISQLKAYLAPFKTPLDPVVRFETEPGRQMQADFTVICICRHRYAIARARRLASSALAAADCNRCAL